MTAAISDDLKQRIVKWYLEDKMTMQDISTTATCSIGLVSKVLRNYRQYGQVNDPYSRRTGRPSYLNADDLHFLETLITANPSLYLDEIQHKLAAVRNVHISIATVCRALATLDLTRKHVTKAAAERDEQLRTMWEVMMAEYLDPDVFVALDESAVDGKTGQRQYGRSPSGQPCVRRMSFLRGVRYSILPALTTEGIIALDIFEGSVTKEIFLSFLQTHVASISIYKAIIC